MATTLQVQDFEKRCATLRRRLNDSDFLENKGLGNEVGIFMFCYDPTLEVDAQFYFRTIVADSEAKVFGTETTRTHIVERNLYDTLIAIAEQRHVLDKLPEQEERRGRDGLLKQIQRIATPEKFVEMMDWQPHNPGDVLLITGVGEVYPFIRVHTILNNMQTTFRDIPVVVAYPGEYDGGSLSLFGKLKDGNYYRAFDLI